MISDLPPRHPYRLEVRSLPGSHQAVGPPLTWRTWKGWCWAQGPQLPQHGLPRAREMWNQEEIMNTIVCIYTRTCKSMVSLFVTTSFPPSLSLSFSHRLQLSRNFRDNPGFLELVLVPQSLTTYFTKKTPRKCTCSNYEILWRTIFMHVTMGSTCTMWEAQNSNWEEY